MSRIDEMLSAVKAIIEAGKENEAEKLTVTFQQFNGSTPLNHAITVTYKKVLDNQ